MIQGYAAVFYNGESTHEFQLGEYAGRDYVERIMPSAFDLALQRPDDVVGLFNHDPDNVLGRLDAGTLRLEVDRRGLRYEIDPPDTQVGRDVAALQGRGDLRGSSFAFRVEEQEIIDDEDRRVREIHSVELIDVGPVTYPAYSGTNTRGACVRWVTSDLRAGPVESHQAAEARSLFGPSRRDLVVDFRRRSLGRPGGVYR